MLATSPNHTKQHCLESLGKGAGAAEQVGWASRRRGAGSRVACASGHRIENTFFIHVFFLLCPDSQISSKAPEHMLGSGPNSPNFCKECKGLRNGQPPSPNFSRALLFLWGRVELTCSVRTFCQNHKGLAYNFISIHLLEFIMVLYVRQALTLFWSGRKSSSTI